MKKLITSLYSITYIIIYISVLTAFSSKSLEITVPVKIYQNLSKTISNPLIGSSKVIIEREEIEQFKDLPIHEIINLYSGIKSRSIYGSNSSGSKTTIDIRGMGAQAKSNVLILINNQRLNNIDMSEIDMPSIPIESIDRIEIIKGNAASVLYGDGVIGGAINIITSPKTTIKQSKNKAVIKKGSFSKNELILNNFQELEKISINSYFNYLETDGYRDENEQQQTNLTTEVIYKGDKRDHFYNLTLSEQIMSTPSDRSQTQLYNDRKGSDTPDDYINSDGFTLGYNSNYFINEKSNFVLNSSFRLKESFSDLQSTSWPSYNETYLTNYQFTPRFNYKTIFLDSEINSTVGTDIQYGDYKSYRKETNTAIPLHVYDAWQNSLSIYNQNSVSLNQYRAGFGLRFQNNKIAISDHLDTSAPDYGGWQNEHDKFTDESNNFAFNIGIDKILNKNNYIYSRIGSGFRYPNIDDRIGGSGGTSLYLKTQKTNDFEIGYNKKNNSIKSDISFYLIEGENELAYDSDGFVNINVNSTRRYGVELGSDLKINDRFTLINNLTYCKAKYTSGNQGSYATDFSGNDIPLVPEYSLDSQLRFNLSKNTNFITELSYQDDMRMESDDENFQNTKIPNHLLINLNIVNRFNNFRINFNIDNLLNEKYFNYAVASSSTNGTYNAYPEPERNFALSLSYEY